MFIHASLELPTSAATAINRLHPALHRNCLGPMSDEAYEEGLTTLARVGPFGDLPWLAKTVQLQVLEPRPIDGGVRVALRWVATGPTGHLFPALDADLEITAIDGERCELSINAVYTPPLGPAGAGIDRLLLNRAARATMRSLLRGLGSSVVAAAQGLDKVVFVPAEDGLTA